MASPDLLLSSESLTYRGVREKYLSVHMKEMPIVIGRSFDILKHAEGMCVLRPSPSTENVVDLIYMLNAYLIKYYLVKHAGHKTIQVSNMNMFIQFDHDGLEKLQNTDYLIMEFADLLVVNHLIPKQVLTTIASLLLERIGARRTTVVQFHNTEFKDVLEKDEDNPFAKFILGCLDISLNIPL